MKTLVISDLHIGSKGCNTKAIINLLKTEEYDRLILVGDIIDGWLFQRYKKFSEAHNKVIRNLFKISKEKEIIWISGNHDEFLRKYTPMQLGNIKIVDEFIEGGIWLCHGDKYDGIIKMHWLGVLGSIGYDAAIVIDRLLKKINKKTAEIRFCSFLKPKWESDEDRRNLINAHERKKQKHMNANTNQRKKSLRNIFRFD
jgi:UDP-2,3-diacylglucosamine pyrophosphatase LpxH